MSLREMRQKMADTVAKRVEKDAEICRLLMRDGGEDGAGVTELEREKERLWEAWQLYHAEYIAMLCMGLAKERRLMQLDKAVRDVVQEIFSKGLGGGPTALVLRNLDPAQTLQILDSRHGQNMLETGEDERVELVVLYLGLECGFPLVEREKTLLRTERGEGIREVMSRRLVATLCIILRVIDGDLGYFDTPLGAKKLISLDCWTDMYDSGNAGIHETDAKALLEEKLLELKQLTPDRLVLLTVLDGVSALDECVPPREGGGGARYALRYLREVQREMYSTNVLLLPLVTGMEPEKSRLVEK